jgi:hypothetical protein
MFSSFPLNQIDPPDSIEYLEQQEKDLTIDNKKIIPPSDDPNNPSTLLFPFQCNWILYIKIMIHSFIPCINKLLTHPDGDIRVTITGFLRKILPIYYSIYCSYYFLSDHSSSASSTSSASLLRVQSSFFSLGYHTHSENLLSLAKLQPSLLHNNDCLILKENLIGIVTVTSSLLSDQPPIPQYCIRLLNDMIEFLIGFLRSNNAASAAASASNNNLSMISHKNASSSSSLLSAAISSFITTLVSEMISLLKSNGGINILVHLLKSTAYNGNGNVSSILPQTSSQEENDNNNNTLDPQLLLLLRNIFEFNKDSASLLLDSDISGSLSFAIIAVVYNNLQFPFNHSSQQQKQQGSYYDDGDERRLLSSSVMISAVNFDLLIPLIDLLHLILHYVLREVSAASNAVSSTHNQQPHSAASPSSLSSATATATIAAQQQYQMADSHKRAIASLKAITPALLMIVAYVESYLQSLPSTVFPLSPGRRGVGTAAGFAAGEGGTVTIGGTGIEEDQEHIMKLHLLETSTRCLGILFDLFSETITNQLISKQSILGSQQQQQQLQSPSYLQNQGQLSLNPRMIFGKIIKNRKVCSCVLAVYLIVLIGFFLLVVVCLGG